MDRILENMILSTSMEKYLAAKLREQERLNEDLALMIRNKAEITPDDVVRLTNLENVVTHMVRNAMSDQERQSVMYQLADLVRK